MSKVVINDLVLKLKVDSRDALKGLNKLQAVDQKRLKKQARFQRRESKSLDMVGAKLVKHNELNKLRSRGHKDSLKYERQLKSALRSGNKTRVARVEEAIKDENLRHKKQIKNQNAEESLKRRSHRDKQKRDRADLIAQRRNNFERSRSSRRMQKRMIGAGSFSGSAPMGLIAGGAIGGAVAGGVATQQLLNFRRAEMAYRASMNVSGSETDQGQMFETIQRNADYLNVNRARHLQTFAQTRSAVKEDKLSDKALMSGLQGMALTAGISGTTQPQLDKAQYGLQQILTSGIQAQEIRQITENMGAAAPAVYDAIGQLTGTKVEGMGQVRRLAETGALSDVDSVDFYKVFTNVLNETYAEEFKKAKNTLPFIFDDMMQKMNNSILAFGKGFDQDMKEVFRDIGQYMVENEETIKDLGKVFGKFVKILWGFIKGIVTFFTPVIKSLSALLEAIPIGALQAFAYTLGLIGTALFSLSAVGRIWKAVTGIKKLLADLAMIRGLSTGKNGGFIAGKKGGKTVVAPTSTKGKTAPKGGKAWTSTASKSVAPVVGREVGKKVTTGVVARGAGVLAGSAFWWATMAHLAYQTLSVIKEVAFNTEDFNNMRDRVENGGADAISNEQGINNKALIDSQNTASQAFGYGVDGGGGITNYIYTDGSTALEIANGVNGDVNWVGN